MPTSPTAPETHELIGTAEAARLLRKSPRTIHRLVAAGDLVPALVAPGGNSGAYLFTRSAIEAFTADRASA